MRPHILAFIEATLEAYAKANGKDSIKRILEVGSYDASGGFQVRDVVKAFFEKSEHQPEFIGLDMRSGPGVDVVADIEKLLPEDRTTLWKQLNLDKGKFQIIFCIETLEHCRRPWQAVKNMKQLLSWSANGLNKDTHDGALVVSVPFIFQIHEHPHDYYRFTADGLDALLQDDDERAELEDYKNPVQTWQDPNNVQTKCEWPHTSYGLYCETPFEVAGYGITWGNTQQTVIPHPAPDKPVIVQTFDDIKHRDSYLARHLAGVATLENVEKTFHKVFFNSMTWQHSTTYLGHKICKCPFDLWTYQEVLCEAKPDFVIETGSAYGGSALYFSDFLKLWGGQIITIDLADTHEDGKKVERPLAANITYLLGSSTDEEIVQKVAKEICRWEAASQRQAKVMVVLDSDHSKKHVLDELEIWSGMVTKGQLLVVEDTNINGHPVAPTFGPGPYEACEAWLKCENAASWEVGGHKRLPPDFVEENHEKFGFSFNRWFRKV